MSSNPTVARPQVFDPEQGAVLSDLTADEVYVHRMKVAKLASQFTCQREFRNFIRSVAPEHRRQMYDMLAPELSFKPLSYLLTKP